MGAIGRVMTAPLMSTSRRLLLILAVAFFSAATSAQTALAPASVAGGEVNSISLAPRAETTQLGVRAGVAETDNIFLSGSPTTSQTLGMLGLALDVRRQGPVLNVDTKGDIEYVDYLQNAYDRELFGRFDGLASLELIPGTLKWVAQDAFGQAQVDPIAPLTPGNLEKVNVFSTGPDLRLRLGTTGYVEMELRYALTHYETSPFNGNRELATLAVGEELSSVSSVSLNVDDQRLRFDNTLINTDYDRRQLYARYQLSGARTNLDFGLGVSQTDETGPWVSAPLAQLTVRRLISPSTTFTLALGHQLTDAADSFRNLRGGTGGGIVIAPVAGTTAPDLANYGSGDVRFERNRTTITLSARWERDSYAQLATLDNSRGALSASLQRRMTPVWSLELQASWQRVHYYGDGYREIDWPVGAALVMTPGKHSDFRLRVDHLRHEVTGPGAAFTENRAYLVAEYWPWP